MVMAKLAIVVAVVVGFQAVGVFGEYAAEKGQCEFDNEPVGLGYFWDPTCESGMLGCDADGKHMECRYCGAGDFLSVDCPPSSCHFPNEPFVSYYWDKECVMGKLGCWADGIHAQCRYCGRYPYTSIPCPEGASIPNSAGCAFDNEPTIPSYWEPGCHAGKFGCLADGRNVNCRYCGQGEYVDIPCPASQVCEFASEPTVPYFWDPSCKEGGLGCNADGIHAECRFCAVRPFEEVECPKPVAPPKDACVWPLKGEPKTPFFFDPTCTMGELGCWADGLNAGCRFCGEGVFANISCPEASGEKLPEQPDLSAASSWLVERSSRGRNVAKDFRSTNKPAPSANGPDDMEVSAGFSAICSLAGLAAGLLMQTLG